MCGVHSLLPISADSRSFLQPPTHPHVEGSSAHLRCLDEPGLAPPHSIRKVSIYLLKVEGVGIEVQGGPVTAGEQGTAELHRLGHTGTACPGPAPPPSAPPPLIPLPRSSPKAKAPQDPHQNSISSLTLSLPRPWLPPLPDMQRDVFGIEVLYHGSGGLVHQLLSQAEAPVGTLHSLVGEGWDLEGCPN